MLVELFIGMSEVELCRKYFNIHFIANVFALKRKTNQKKKKKWLLVWWNDINKSHLQHIFTRLARQSNQQ